MIKVRALKAGYYGLKRKSEGELFFIKAEKDFSKNWMEKVGAREAVEEESDSHSHAKHRLKGDGKVGHHAKKHHKGKGKHHEADVQGEEGGEEAEHSEEQEPSGNADVI